MPLLTLLLCILSAVVCGLLGSSKGYNAVLSAVAGFFLNIFGIVILLLLPDQERISSDASSALSYRDREIQELRARIEKLEAEKADAEAKNAPKHADPAEPEDSSASAQPASFPTRTHDVIACPRCGKRQTGNRNMCYSCGLEFHYDDEPSAPLDENS